MKTYTILKTESVGDLLFVANETHLIGIYFVGGKNALAPQNDWKRDPKHPVLQLAVEQMNEYLACKRKDFDLPLDAEGTDFQRAVWKQIARIPFGKTISYSELARRVGKPDAVRAAGSATGMNPHCIVVPCHRVLHKDGGLGGFAGGLPRKKRLLAVENDQAMSFFKTMR